MGFIRSIIALLFIGWLLGPLVGLAQAPDSTTLQGTVVGENDQPLAHAAVFIYSAHLKKGFSVVCPTCWIDCGKHTETDDSGRFVLAGVSPDLKFRLLAAMDGYSTAQRGGIDPAQGPLDPIKLKLRATPADPRKVLRGRIIGTEGQAIAGALIEPLGGFVEPAEASFPPQLDPLAVSNEAGEFDMSGKLPYDKVLFRVSPRGFAPVIAIAPTGEKRRTVRVSQGATVMGQLVRKDGAPIANVELILVNGQDAQYVENFGDMRVGTDRDGKFVFTNVPAGFLWRIYTSESLVPSNLAGQPRWCETKSDGEVVNVGKLALAPGLKLKGHVVGADVKVTNISILGDTLRDPRIAPLSPDGDFEFQGLTSGAYHLEVGGANADPIERAALDLLLEHDRTDVTFRAIPIVKLAE